jgi:hypothetical protein
MIHYYTESLFNKLRHCTCLSVDEFNILKRGFTFRHKNPMGRFHFNEEVPVWCSHKNAIIKLQKEIINA